MPNTDPLPLLPQRRRGPKKLPTDALRLHTVSARLNAAELAELDAARALVQMQRGEYLRHAAVGVLPPTIPQINREAWADLARVCGNLNQYQHLINSGEAAGHDPLVIEQLGHQVQQLRFALLGVDPQKEGDDEGEG
jgi:hypothetical protein